MITHVEIGTGPTRAGGAVLNISLHEKSANG